MDMFVSLNPIHSAWWSEIVFAVLSSIKNKLNLNL
jgi:hypothetical protein